MKYMLEHKYKGVFQGFYNGILIFYPFDEYPELGIWSFENPKEAMDLIKKFRTSAEKEEGTYEIKRFDKELHEKLLKIAEKS